ncbi:MAG: hypothetical protein Q9195_002335 [Heterodermia aff. obscurata]
MAVPRQTQIYPGVSVNIVLKADQRSGKLTTGQIADILTKGDHPRGIKVRLVDGQIGRVQSLLSSSSSLGAPQTPSGHSGLPSHNEKGFARADGDSRPRGFQQDVRTDGHDPAALPEMGSLADYIKAPRKKKRGQASQPSPAKPESTAQQELEVEFPGLDSSLIAAIVADHGDVGSARDTLRTLS